MDWKRYKYALYLFVAFVLIAAVPQIRCGQLRESRWVTAVSYPGGVALRLPISAAIAPETVDAYGGVSFDGKWPLFSDALHMLRDTDITGERYENAYGHALLLRDRGELYLLATRGKIEDYQVTYEFSGMCRTLALRDTDERPDLLLPLYLIEDAALRDGWEYIEANRWYACGVLVDRVPADLAALRQMFLDFYSDANHYTAQEDGQDLIIHQKGFRYSFCLSFSKNETGLWVKVNTAIVSDTNQFDATP